MSNFSLRYIWLTYMTSDAGGIKVKLDGLSGVAAQFTLFSPAQIRNIGQALIVAADRATEERRSTPEGLVITSYRIDIDSTPGNPKPKTEAA